MVDPLHTPVSDDLPGRIVVGVDGSESSKHALAWAEIQAGLTGARLVAVTSWEFPINGGQGLIGVEGLDFAGDAHRLLEQTLLEVLGAAPTVDVEPLVLEGHAAQVLCDIAEGADLLVVGNRGRGELVGLLIGSVSEYVASHAPCPVVIVRSKHH